MVNVTISISDSLNNRLKKFPDLNKSDVFQKAVGKKLKILEQLERKEVGIVAETIAELKESFEDNSFQFGKDMCLEWIREGTSYSSIKMASSFAGKEEVFDELYRQLDNQIGPIEVYEEIFDEQEGGAILSKEEFAKGFTLEARMVINAIKD